MALEEETKQDAIPKSGMQDFLAHLSKVQLELKQQIQVAKEEIRKSDELFKACAKDLEDNLKYTKQLEKTLERNSEINMTENNSFIEEINKLKAENDSLKHKLRFSLDKFEEIHAGTYNKEPKLNK